MVSYYEAFARKSWTICLLLLGCRWEAERMKSASFHNVQTRIEQPNCSKFLRPEARFLRNGVNLWSWETGDTRKFARFTFNQVILFKVSIIKYPQEPIMTITKLSYFLASCVQKCNESSPKMQSHHNAFGTSILQSKAAEDAVFRGAEQDLLPTLFRFLRNVNTSS